MCIELDVRYTLVSQHWGGAHGQAPMWSVGETFTGFLKRGQESEDSENAIAKFASYWLVKM